MEIKKAKYKNVKVTQKKLIHDAIYGCDECGKEIEKFPNEPSRLEVKIFFKNDRTEYLHFCSWECVLTRLPKLKSDYFINIPFMYFDEEKSNKRSGQHLQLLLSKMKLK